MARFLAIAENTVFLLLTALIRNFYKTIIQRLGVKKFGLNATSRIKAFVFRFISVPAKWIRTSKRYVLNIYTCNNAYADVFQTDFADSINASDVEEWARTINEDDNNTTEEKGAKKKGFKIIEVLGFALACIGLSYMDFCRLTLEEFNAVSEAYNSKCETAFKNDWERDRMFTTIAIQPHVSKKLQPKEMLPFPWEEAKPKEAVILSPKERKERFEEILKRVRDQRF